MHTVRVVRLSGEPIIRPGMDERMGSNINGPSLIRAPDWLEEPIGRYYLYFADHKGAYIRLACADALAGPWRVYTPGTLTLEESHFATERPDLSAVSDAKRAEGEWTVERDHLRPHIASPDVHVDHDRREIRMYYHGMLDNGEQRTRVAVSTDGIVFAARPELLGNSYFRVFRHRGWHYALVMPGEVRRSRDGLTGFESGPVLFRPEMRHAAVRYREDALDVFWTRVGDAPERILHSRVRIDGEWTEWQDEAPRPRSNRSTTGKGRACPSSHRRAVRPTAWYASSGTRACTRKTGGPTCSTAAAASRESESPRSWASPDKENPPSRLRRFTTVVRRTGSGG